MLKSPKTSAIAEGLAKKNFAMCDETASTTDKDGGDCWCRKER